MLCKSIINHKIKFLVLFACEGDLFELKVFKRTEISLSCQIGLHKSVKLWKDIKKNILTKIKIMEMIATN